MAFILLGPALNLRYQFKPSHYAISLFGCFLGAAIALHQICLHICPTFPEYGKKILGLEIYTWSFIAFCLSILVIAVLLIIYHPEDSQTKLKMHGLEKIGIFLLGIILLANSILIFLACGWSLC
ncbi:MAG: hypothetical protein Tsb0015_07250 [Simkaniaceae bacterium]